jgi:hypothetical protein
MVNEAQWELPWVKTLDALRAVVTGSSLSSAPALVTVAVAEGRDSGRKELLIDPPVA